MCRMKTFVTGQVARRLALWLIIMSVLCTRTGFADTIVVVDRLDDAPGSSANCRAFPIPSLGQCNIRSAWKYCNENSDAASSNICFVKLQSNTYHTVSAEFGELVLDPGAAVYVESNNPAAHITATGNDSARRRLSDESHSTRMQIESVNQFPVQTATMQDTNSAQQGFETACVTACSLDTLTFAACSAVDAATQDTYFRLFDASGVEVATNDDSCGYGSQIIYPVPSGNACQNYCLRIGCYGSRQCTAYVTLTIDKFDTGSEGAITTRFVAYRAPDGAMTPPELVLRELVFHNFGAKQGGIVYIDGDVKFQMLGVTVSTVYANEGGAAFIGNNSAYSVFSQCTFVSATATSGGAIYLRNVQHAILQSSLFERCVATEQGGAILLASDNSVTLISGNTFRNCTADQGGALAINTRNEHYQMEDNTFSLCTAFTGGGAIYVGVNNVGGVVNRCKFDYCTAYRSGGAIALKSGNHGFRIEDSTITHCKTTLVLEEPAGGGGVAVLDDNNQLAILGTNFTECSAATYGGGLFLLTSNDDSTVTSSLFASCSGKYGGGLAMYADNKRVVLHDNTFKSCTGSTSGGGIFVSDTNTDLRVAGGLISQCQANFYGGGVHLVFQNHRAVFDHVQLVENRATASTNDSKGGAIALSTSNYNVTLLSVQIQDSVAGVGAGVYVGQDNRQVSLTDTTIVRCTAQQDGGGVYISRTNQGSSITTSEIVNCTAVQSGGGIYLDSLNGNFAVRDSTIRGCSAADGGGLYANENDSPSFQRTTITHCTATGMGGGAYLYGANEAATFDNCTLSYNTAGESGGGLVSGASNTQLHIVQTVFLSNEATLHGGGLYVESGNDELAVLSKRTNEERQVLQTAHPHPAGNFEATTTASTAEGFYVYFSSDSEILTSDYTTITAGDGSVMFDSRTDSWPGVSAPPLYVQGSVTLKLYASTDEFSKGTSSSPVWGLQLNCLPVFDTVEGGAIFDGNEAGKYGGGLYMFSGIQYPILIGAQFARNHAANGGGGMYLRIAIVGMVAHQVNFHSNKAFGNDGGAVAMQSACYDTLYSKCVFSYNEAAGSGGALAILSNNGGDGDSGINADIDVVRECHFEYNTASGDGGAIYLETENTFRIEDSLLEFGTAGADGGALALSDTNIVYVLRSTLRNNTAWGSDGGAIMADYDNRIVLYATHVLSNTAAGSGGGIYLHTRSGLTLQPESTLVNNVANIIGGGALACVGSYVPVFQGTVVRGNFAARGSGAYFNGVLLDGTLDGATFIDNTASVGTVYWVNDSMKAPDGLYDTERYVDNTLWYGGNVATQAVRLVVPHELTVDEYGAFLDPPIEVTLLDQYGQLVPAALPAYLQVGILGASADSCSGRYPYLSGASADAGGVPISAGKAKIDAVEAACFPGGSITLLYTAHLSDHTDLTTEQQTLYGTTTLNFRDCVEGEYIVNGKCTVCPYGSYSLSADVTAETTCTECQSLSSVESCEGSTIVLREGYWRRYPTSEAIITCLDELSGCAGGNSTGDASCTAGYEGPLCSVCSQGYYRSEKKCIPCVESDKMSPAAIFFLTIGAFGATILLVYVLLKSHSREIGGAAMLLSLLGTVGVWFKKEIRDLKVQLKILITTFQICSTIPIAMTVTFPPQFARYLNALSVFNLNVMSVVPVNCANSGKYNFVDKLIMLTLAPIGLSLLILVLCIVEVTYRSMKLRRKMTVAATAAGSTADPATTTVTISEADETLRSKIKTRYLTMFFFLTYLVLPFISTTIFRTFLCTNADPNDEDSNPNDRFLTADMRISCHSPYYKRGVAYAAVMIVVYVLGIPSMYAFLLYRSRHEIATRFDPLKDEHQPVEPTEEHGKTVGDVEQAASESKTEEKVLVVQDPHNPENQLRKRTDHAARQALAISFLYDAYEPQYWYWEVVETTRRLMLTAVLSVCGAGTSGQALFALLLALMYIKLYGHFAPYLKINDDIVAETGQFQIFLSFLGALVYQRQLLGAEWNSVVGGFLILINTAVFVLFVYFASNTLYKYCRRRTDLDAAGAGNGEQAVEMVEPAKVVTAAGSGRNNVDLRKVYIAEDNGQSPTAIRNDAQVAE